MMELEGDLQIVAGGWRRLGPSAAEVRRAVFIEEQGIDESEEWDDVDAGAGHWVALLDGEAVGCARMSAEGKIGRMAVLANYRGYGIGTRLLQACVDYAVERNFDEVRLSAQQHALSFYERQGFVPVGPPHEEVGIAHQWMHRKLSDAPKPEALQAYLMRVRSLLDTLPSSWVTGTISELRRHGNGQVYFTLVQTDTSGAPIAKGHAMVWRSEFIGMERRFRQATGLSLSNNQDVMVLVRAQTHELYGFTLVVQDIYPEFTLGRLAARLEQIRRQLKADGLYDRNRVLGLPIDFFRVAVLSPADAAGLGDFRSRADGLAGAGVLEFVYFTATFQGQQTASSVCAGLRAIQTAHAQQPFDAAVIIRGGGSQWDLACLNELPIAQAICNMPMPVLCGIGHERDSTIIDEIVCHRLATPSMVIDWIESTVMARLQRVLVNLRDIRQCAVHQMQQAGIALRQLQEQVQERAANSLDQAVQSVHHLRERVSERAQQRVEQSAALTAQHVAAVRELARQRVELVRHDLMQVRQTIGQQARQDAQQAAQRLELLRAEALPQAVAGRLEWADLQLQRLFEQVQAQDPQRVLERGYAIVTDAHGRPLPDVKAIDAQSDGALSIRLRDGSVAVQRTTRTVPTQNSSTADGKKDDGKIVPKGADAGDAKTRRARNETQSDREDDA